MAGILATIKRIKEVYDWATFADAARLALETKAGISVIAGFLAAITGAILQVTWYEMAMMGIGVAIVVQTYSILRLMRIPKSPLEIVFDPTDTAYVRPTQGLYGPTGEFYSVGVHNAGGVTLHDVTARALDSWMTREAISVAQHGHPVRRHSPVEIFSVPALHPDASEVIELFGLDFNSTISHPDYIFNTVQRFTLEVMARDVATVREEFEYDPKARPMIRKIDRSA